MFTLNVLFNFNQTDGRFTGDRGTGALGRSMNWLRFNGSVEPDPILGSGNLFNPEDPTIWDNLGEAKSLHLRRSLDPGNICIRVAQAPEDPNTKPKTPAPDPAATLQLAVSFGRPVNARASQNEASPFKDPPPIVRTTFIFNPTGPIPRNSPAPGSGAVAWFFHLGKIPPGPSDPPLDPNLTDRYEFSLGIIVQSGGETHYYGEDPGMDIGD